MPRAQLLLDVRWREENHFDGNILGCTVHEMLDPCEMHLRRLLFAGRVTVLRRTDTDATRRAGLACAKQSALSSIHSFLLDFGVAVQIVVPVITLIHHVIVIPVTELAFIIRNIGIVAVLLLLLNGGNVDGQSARRFHVVAAATLLTLLLGRRRRSNRFRGRKLVILESFRKWKFTMIDEFDITRFFRLRLGTFAHHDGIEIGFAIAAITQRTLEHFEDR
mmetsp:Transcript_14471/g.41077  ORF Transcript_14471/g.41077 Transcript_14471/m.41077 type:complete len:220 (-) Transcript_14471:1778-2437(-)